MTYYGSIFNAIIMKIVDVGIWYELIGLNFQKGKIYRNLWVVFLMLWTLLGLGHDIILSLSLSQGLFGLKREEGGVKGSRVE